MSSHVEARKKFTGIDKVDELILTSPDSDCWYWHGSTDKEYYGLIKFNGKMWRVHRLTYTLLVGEIPKTLAIDHLCRVHHCVNPDHLEPVTSRENSLRGETLAALNHKKTHCKNGHVLSRENCRKAHWPKRLCQICHKQNSQDLYFLRKALEYAHATP